MTATLALTDEEQKTLHRVAAQNGLTTDGYVESVAKRLLHTEDVANFHAAVRRTFGTWESHDPDWSLDGIRASWDREIKEF